MRAKNKSKLLGWSTASAMRSMRRRVPLMKPNSDARIVHVLVRRHSINRGHERDVDYVKGMADLIEAVQTYLK